MNQEMRSITSGVYSISDVTPQDYPRLIDIWERSVRATHHFLNDTDISFFRELILNKYFDLVHLKALRNEAGEIPGFIGISADKIEMLFVDPLFMSQGYGKTLLRYAVNETGARFVDVNEQNEKAVGFYYGMGFQLEKRSPLDGMGMPYPILHLKLP
jgi:putative acetyltransferase